MNGPDPPTRWRRAARTLLPAHLPLVRSSSSTQYLLNESRHLKAGFLSSFSQTRFWVVDNLPKKEIRAPVARVVVAIPCITSTSHQPPATSTTIVQHLTLHRHGHLTTQTLCLMRVIQECTFQSGIWAQSSRPKDERQVTASKGLAVHGWLMRIGQDSGLHVVLACFLPNIDISNLRVHCTVNDP